MPFPQTPLATGSGCILCNEYRMPLHWRLFLINIGSCLH
jgi:hypothetical protein